MSIDVMRLLQLAAHRAPAIATVQVGVHVDVAHYLLNKRRKEIAALEERGKLEIQVTGQPGISPDTLQVRCFDHNGNEVRLLPPPPLPRLAAGRTGRGDRERGDEDAIAEIETGETEAATTVTASENLRNPWNDKASGHASAGRV